MISARGFHVVSTLDYAKGYEAGTVFWAEYSDTHRHLTDYTGVDDGAAIEEHCYEALKSTDEVLKHIYKDTRAFEARLRMSRGDFRARTWYEGSADAHSFQLHRQEPQSSLAFGAHARYETWLSEIARRNIIKTTSHHAGVSSLRKTFLGDVRPRLPARSRDNGWPAIYIMY